MGCLLTTKRLPDPLGVVRFEVLPALPLEKIAIAACPDAAAVSAAAGLEKLASSSTSVSRTPRTRKRQGEEDRLG